MLLEIPFSLGRIILQELLFIGQSRVALGRSLADMLLDEVIALSFGLIDWNRHVLMELILLADYHFLDSTAHLPHKEDVELRVEAVLVVLL